jgi:hypothetical protein
MDGNLDSPNAPTRFFHLSKVDGNQLRGRTYTKGEGGRLLLTGDEDDLIPQMKLTEARIVRKEPTGKVADFNLENVSDYDSLWAFGVGRVKDLGLDPKEWYWKKLGSLQEGNFFSYTTSPNTNN